MAEHRHRLRRKRTWLDGLVVANDTKHKEREKDKDKERPNWTLINYVILEEKDGRIGKDRKDLRGRRWNKNDSTMGIKKKETLQGRE